MNGYLYGVLAASLLGLTIAALAILAGHESEERRR